MGSPGGTGGQLGEGNCATCRTVHYFCGYASPVVRVIELERRKSDRWASASPALFSAERLE